MGSAGVYWKAWPCGGDWDSGCDSPKSAPSGLAVRGDVLAHLWAATAAPAQAAGSEASGRLRAGVLEPGHMLWGRLGPIMP